MAAYRRIPTEAEASQFLPDKQRWNEWPDGVQADGEGGHKVRVGDDTVPVWPGNWVVSEDGVIVALYGQSAFEDTYEEI